MQLGFDSQNKAKASSMWAILDALKTELYIPELVFDEFVVQQQGLFQTCLAELDVRIKKINNRIDSKIEPLDSKKQLFKKEFLDNLNKKLQEAGISIFKTPYGKIELKEIVNMAVRKSKPFKGNDSGFKDVVILLSVIEHAKAKSEGEHVFVTNNTKDFQGEEIQELIKSKGANLKVIFSLKELEAHLENFLEEVMRQYLQQRRERLQQHLNTKRQGIEQFIQRAVKFSKEALYIGGNVNQIEAIELNEISSPEANELKDKTEDDVPITFQATLKVTILVTKFIKTTPVLRLGEVDTSDAFSAETVQEIVYKTVDVQGKIHICKDAEGKKVFSGLQLEMVEEHYDNLYSKALLGTPSIC